MKDEDWGGVFVDFFAETVQDRSMFKVVVEKDEVSCSFDRIVCME